MPGSFKCSEVVDSMLSDDNNTDIIFPQNHYELCKCVKVRLEMNGNAVQEYPYSVLQNCQTLTREDVLEYRKQFSLEKTTPLSLQDGRTMLANRLGEQSLAELLIEMRRED